MELQHTNAALHATAADLRLLLVNGDSVTDIEYERDAWLEIQQYKRAQAERSPRRLMPKGVRDKVDDWSDRAKQYLESAPGYETFMAAFRKAATGVVSVIGKLGMRSVNSRRVLRSYSKANQELKSIRDIRALPLSVIDDTKPSLDLLYAGSTTVTGAGFGFMAGGGTMIAAGGSVAGGGAAAAPGMAMVTSILATDAALTLAAVHRGVAHVAIYYGYDQRLPEEGLFALGVMNAALAGAGGKAAAYAQLNTLVQKLARDATWKQLNEHAISLIVRKVHERFGYELTKRKLGEATPVVGAFIGGGMNAHLLNSALEEANMLYRERFLADRYGPEGPKNVGASTFVPDPSPEQDGAETLDSIVNIVEAQVVEMDAPAGTELDGGAEPPK